MKKIISTGALLCLLPLLVCANTSHEFIAGLERDSSSEVVAEENSQLTLAYTYYLAPLTDDAPHIDLRSFYQHPSRISGGIGVLNNESEDRTDPANVIKSDMSANLLLLNGEYYLPSNTGLLLSLGSGSGSLSVSMGAYETKADVELKMFNLGLRQYAAQNVAFHIRSSSEEFTGDLTGAVQGSVKEQKSLVLLGGQVVFADVVGFMLEAGRGEKESDSPFTLVAGTPDNYDVAEVKAGLTVYASKRFSLLLGVELDGQFQQSMPAGHSHEITGSKVRLAPRYWFSENLGMEVGIYNVTTEELTVTPASNTTTTSKSSGALLNLGYRF